MNLKVLAVYDLEGNEKENTPSMDYNEIRNNILREIHPIEIGKSAVLEIYDSKYGYMSTSIVEEFELEGLSLKVITRNTIYEFEILD